MATITFVGAGTPATAVNASVTPVVHASTAVGDLVIIQASIRNSGTGDVNLPAGWTSLVYSGHHRIMGRIWQAGDVAPTVTFGAGVANADTIAQVTTWRGVSPQMLTALAASAAQLNGSAQDIAYPALTVPADRHLVILAAWKQDDVTAVSTPATMTSIETTSVTAGDDAAQSWRYVIQTTAANIGSGTLTVTGGAAAISRAILLALKPAATVTVTEQDAYPPRALISVTDLNLGDSVVLYRSAGGLRTPVRAGASASVTDPSFVRVDAELPFGVPVSYVATVNGVDYVTAPVAYTLPGGKVVLSDAVAGLAAEVVVRAWPEKTYDRQSSTYRAGGRNVVVAGDLAGWTGTVDVYVETTPARDAVMQLVDGATEGVVQIRQPGGYDGVDSYVAVLSVVERRFSQDGSDDRRIVTLDVVEVEPWAPALEARGFTLQDIADAYTGLTLANLSGDYANLLAVALSDWS